MFDLKTVGPIPGENFTADTRNYPWHRPPEIETYDGTVDYVMQRMNDETTAEIVYSLMELGRPLTNIVAGLMMQGIGRGKFQIDMAILAAGPVYRYLQILADSENIKYEDGLNAKRTPITSTTLKMMMGVVDDVDPEETDPESAVEAVSEGEGGLMAPAQPAEEMTATAEEQALMLGGSDTEEEVV
jgi:hypothetical protein